MGRYDVQWAMLRAADAARRGLCADPGALQVLDLALFKVLNLKPSQRRPFDRTRTLALPARAALTAWRGARRGPDAAARPPSKAARVVLFCVWDDSALKHQLPVAQELAQSRDATPMFLVFRDPGLVARLKSAALPAAWVGAGVTRRERLDAVLRFTGQVPAALRAARHLQAGLTEEKGATISDRLLVDTMLFAVAGVAPLELATRRFMAELSPSALVLSNHEMPVGRMLARIAEERAVPLIQVQHGIMGRHPKHCWPHQGTMCVWGEQTKRILQALGWSGVHIEVCGAPGLDGLGRLERGASRASGATRKILFTPVSGNSLAPAAEVQAAARLLYSALAGRADVELIVKPHPADKLNLAERNLGDFPGLRANVVREGDLHRMMLEADVLVTMWSTTALEGVLLDKPVIVVDSGNDDPLPIVEYGAAIKAGTARALTQALERIATGTAEAALAEGRTRFCRDFAHGNDGRAAERTARVILETTLNAAVPRFSRPEHVSHA